MLLLSQNGTDLVEAVHVYISEELRNNKKVYALLARYGGKTFLTDNGVYIGEYDTWERALAELEAIAAFYKYNSTQTPYRIR